MPPSTTIVCPVMRLTSADVSEETLASLRSVIVFYAFDEEFPNRAICSRTSAGWNDCFETGGAVSEIGGKWIEGFVDDTGILEIFLFGPDADLANPFFRLGTVHIPLGESSPTDTLAIRVDINVDAVRGQHVDGSIAVGEIVNIDDIDVVGDAYWSFALTSLWRNIPGQQHQ